ncbi:MAG: cysteine desulfurase [Candidatus Marsarchaeota archaeon]|nr:cysteine desulfurase [Candidatus Marsarchaeota archaeon]
MARRKLVADKHSEKDEVAADVEALGGKLRKDIKSITKQAHAELKRTGEVPKGLIGAFLVKRGVLDIVEDAVEYIKYDGMTGGPAIEDALEGSIKNQKYQDTKTAGIHELLQEDRSKAGVSNGMLIFAQEMTFGDTRNPLKQLIKELGSEFSARMEEVDKKVSNSEFPEDFHFVDIATEEIIAVMNAWEPHLKDRDKGMPGVIVYEIAKSVFKQLDGAKTFFKPDAEGRSYERVMSLFLTDAGSAEMPCASESKSANPEVAAMLVLIEQAAKDLAKSKQEELDKVYQ